MVAIEVTEGVFVNGRGQKLRTYSYVPTVVRCVLFFHHGYGTYHLPGPSQSTASPLRPEA